MPPFVRSFKKTWLFPSSPVNLPPCSPATHLFLPGLPTGSVPISPHSFHSALVLTHVSTSAFPEEHRLLIRLYMPRLWHAVHHWGLVSGYWHKGTWGPRLHFVICTQGSPLHGSSARDGVRKALCVQEVLNTISSASLESQSSLPLS